MFRRPPVPPPRRVLAVAAVATFLLVVGVWGLSYIRRVTVPRQVVLGQRQTSWLLVNRGAVSFNTAYNVPRAVNKATTNTGQSWFGFSGGDRGPPDAGPGDYSRHRWLAVPLWFVTAVAAAIASLLVRPAVVEFRRARLSRCRRCRTCGYDCRATPDRCPECGVLAPCSPAAVSPSSA